jgi:hypothetical protein
VVLVICDTVYVINVEKQSIILQIFIGVKFKKKITYLEKLKKETEK